MNIVPDFGEDFSIDVVMGGSPVTLNVKRVADFWRVTFEGMLVVDAFLQTMWYQGSTKQIDDVLFERITDALDKHFGGI